MAARLEIDHPASTLAIDERAIDDDIGEPALGQSRQRQLALRLSVLAREDPLSPWILRGARQRIDDDLHSRPQLSFGHPVPAQLPSELLASGFNGPSRHRGGTESFQVRMYRCTDAARGLLYPAELQLLLERLLSDGQVLECTRCLELWKRPVHAQPAQRLRTRARACGWSLRSGGLEARSQHRPQRGEQRPETHHGASVRAPLRRRGPVQGLPGPSRCDIEQADLLVRRARRHQPLEIFSHQAARVIADDRCRRHDQIAIPALPRQIEPPQEGVQTSAEIPVQAR